MKMWRKNFIILTGFVEALLFSGCLFGWPSLLLILQREGIYGYLCEIKNVDPLSTVTENSMYTTVSGMFNFDELSSSFEDKSEYILLSDVEKVGVDDLTETYTLKPFIDSTESQTWSETTAEILDCKEPCNLLNETNLTIFTTVVGCDEQRIYMTLIYTFAAVSYGITAVFIGISLEFFGIRVTRAVGSIFSILGFICLANITPETSNLLWPALNLLALGTNQLRLSGFLFADLWPKYRATIITAYSSAYAVSTTFFLGVQILYEREARMDLVYYISAGACSITFIPTFLMPPRLLDNKDSVHSVESGQNLKQGEEDKDTHSDETSAHDAFISENHENLKGEKQVELELESNSDAAVGKLSVWDSVFCVSGLLHMFWHFINLFLVLFYSSTFNIWISKVSNRVDDASLYIKMSGVFCLIAPFLIPYTGVLTDRMVRRAEKLTDPVKRLAYKMQAPTFAMAGATTLMVLVMICKIFLDEIAIYASLVLIALARPMVVGSCTSYIRLRFPAEQFNILNGVFTTIISIICFVQYPIMKWMTSSNDGYMMVHIVLLIALLLSLISPGHMMIRKNILKYARQHLHGST
ncbi:unnamed protein product [Orchesella dallaii]|uniref:Solute carrier family 43 member 3 n=1 Tax=Orchesella dallaii TaxID=48710 RepID=A0ABP1Q0H0_9HEXA